MFLFSWRKFLTYIWVLPVIIGIVQLSPRAFDAAEILLLNDTYKLAKYRLSSLPSEQYEKQIQLAIEGKDIELADSIVLLAQQQNVMLDSKILEDLEQEKGFWKTSTRVSQDLWSGVTTGESVGMAGLSAALVSDMTSIGDVRDFASEIKRWPDQDNIVLALSGTGLLLTGATVMSAGAAAPMKTGISIVKLAKKTGRISKGLSVQIKNLSKEIVDKKILGEMANKFKNIRFSQLVSANYWDDLTVTASKLISINKAKQVLGIGGSVNNIKSTAGFKGALDALSRADSIKDIKRLEYLSGKLKSAFRGALMILPDIAKSVYRVSMFLIEMIALLISIITALIYVAWVVVKMCKSIFKGRISDIGSV
ncbi:hypothetical protein QD228_13545 [Cobetia sp. 3AK]|uniref:hypothetical protein n=1 Tax=Cobetia sp. 3AK TaxID=3040020 RepID=UPI00244B1AC0|nr:hypothetical protein [Cobetia sp. 3AK]MDH2374865.1 hypothetical protein [Cobetia sp. 3AK]